MTSALTARWQRGNVTSPASLALGSARGFPATSAVLWAARRVPDRLAQAGAAAGAGAALLLLQGVVVVISAPFLGLAVKGWPLLIASPLTLVILVALSLRLPWQTWSPSATLAYPFFGLGLLAIFALTTQSIASAYVGVIPLWFLYCGLFHRMLAGALLVPFAWVVYYSMVGSFSPSTAVRLAVYGAVWFAISAILSVMSSQQHLITEHLRLANHTDSLTGLGNRRGLELRLADVAVGDCVVVCDLDLFKSINDAFGHAAGDEVLAQFGTTVDQHMRGCDYAARFGGEEFALILVRTDPAQVVAALSALRTRWLDLEAGVTFSAGIASVVDGLRPDAVLAAADAALYDAKAAGRDCFRLSPWDRSISGADGAAGC